MISFKLFLDKTFTHRERENCTPERTAILKAMTPGQSEPEAINCRCPEYMTKECKKTDCPRLTS